MISLWVGGVTIPSLPGGNGIYATVGGIILGAVTARGLIGREKEARRPERERVALDGWSQYATRLEHELAAVRTELTECTAKHRDADRRADAAEARIAVLEREIGEMHEWAKGHAEGIIKSREDDHP